MALISKPSFWSSAEMAQKVWVSSRKQAKTSQDFPGGASGKKKKTHLPLQDIFTDLLQTWVWPLGQEDSLEEGTATLFSILAWRMPWTEKPSRLQSITSHRVGHDWSNLACIRDYSHMNASYFSCLRSRALQQKITGGTLSMLPSVQQCLASEQLAMKEGELEVSPWSCTYQLVSSVLHKLV